MTPIAPSPREWSPMKKKPKPSTPPDPSRSDGDLADSPSEERLQKVLAAAGIGSRRQCEELILEGRVEIDGQVVQELGVKVDPRRHEVRVDGTRLARPTRRYYVINKPAGVVCTNRDPAGRIRLVDLLPTDERLFSVGRLDRASEGMILVTNDGEFANRLAHPRYGVHKTYRVIVAGRPEPAQLKQLLDGVHLAEGVARAVSVRVKKMHKDSADLEIVLNEGKNREIRRVLARIGHKVLRLKRIAIGSVKLADLPTGDSRRLTSQEVRTLLGETGVKSSGRSPKPSRKRSTPSGSSTTKKARSPASDAHSTRAGTILTFDGDAPPSSSRPKKSRPGQKATARRPAGRPGSRKAASRKVSAGQGRGGGRSPLSTEKPSSGKRSTRGSARGTQGGSPAAKPTGKRRTASGGHSTRKSDRRGGEGGRGGGKRR
jgi:23S rRNA pseudouridine2605 synthase